jgi:hypothetical protein
MPLAPSRYGNRIAPEFASAARSGKKLGEGRKSFHNHPCFQRSRHGLSRLMPGDPFALPNAEKSR